MIRNVFALLRQDGRNPAIVWVVANPAVMELFDRVATFENGRLLRDDDTEVGANEGPDYKEMAS
ncbi:hypothetical protein D3C72_2261280 [compost metagenome]